MRKLRLSRDKTQSVTTPSTSRRRTSRRHRLLAATSIGATMALTSMLQPAVAAAVPGLTHLVTTRCQGGSGVIDITMLNGSNSPVDVSYDVTELQSFATRTMTANPLSAVTGSVTGRHDATYTVTMEYAGLERTALAEVDCVVDGIPASQDFTWEIAPTCESSGGMLTLNFSNGTDGAIDYTWDVTELGGFAARSETVDAQSFKSHRVTGRHDDTYTVTIEYDGLERTEQVEVNCAGIPASQDFTWEITPTCAPSGGVLNLVFSNGTDDAVDYSWDVTELRSFAPRSVTVDPASTKTHQVFGRHDRRYTITIEYNGLERTEQVDVACEA